MFFHTDIIHIFIYIDLIYFRDDHQFSPLHWCAKEGHTKLVEMLLARGARVNIFNMGDDIPLHLAAAHGHLDIVREIIEDSFLTIVF
jgi:ankyrin repeat protein